MSIQLPVCFFVLILTQIGTQACADNPGDPIMGKRLFAQCGACHTTEVDGPNKIGPNLHGIFGRKAGSLSNFSYSEAMQKSGVIWDAATLSEYIKQPADFVPGNKMPFPGVPKEQARADIIAYLKETTK